MTIQAPDPINEVKVILEVSLAILIFVAVGWLVWDNGHLREIVDRQAHEITDYKGANEQFADQVKGQNEAIDSLKATEKTREENAAKAIAAAQKDAQLLYDKAEKIMAKKPTQPNDCANAKNLLNNYFGGR